jgi:beta-glucosidase
MALLARRLSALLLLPLYLASPLRAQPAPVATQPATRPAVTDPNSGPPDVAAPKTNAAGQNDAGFRSMHQSFLARGKAGPIGVLFLGDSITQFWSRTPAAQAVFDAHYAKYQPANFGISGDKTQHVLWRIENGELDGIHPCVVVLLIGTNNFRDPEDAIYRGDKKIIDEIHQKLPDSGLIIMGIFPRGDGRTNALLDSRYPDGPHIIDGRAKLQAVNAQLAKLDDGKKTRYLDIWDKLLDSNGMLTTDIMADYLHPTTKGYQIWADAMQPLLDEMMAGGPATAPTTAPAK